MDEIPRDNNKESLNGAPVQQEYAQQPVYPPQYDYPQQPYLPQYRDYGQQVAVPQPQSERRSVKPLLSFIFSCASFLTSMFASFFFLAMIRSYQKHLEKLKGLQRYSSNYAKEKIDYFFGQGFIRFFADCVLIIALGIGIAAITFALISFSRKSPKRIFPILALCITPAGFALAAISVFSMINIVY